MKKALVVIPTYNERDTVQLAIHAVLKHEGFDILVVDDGSPDGTAAVVREITKNGERVHLLERPGKLGLGTAYITAFKWGLVRGYEYFIEMDADGSHDPAALPAFIKEMGLGCGLVVGSRYLGGTISVVGWDFRRLLLSKFGNYYASWTLGLPLTDMTSGFRCYSRKALESLNLDKIHSTGYAFQIEMACRVSWAGFPIGEIPIVFSERASGSSKMSKRIIREAVILPWRLRLGRIRDAELRDFAYHCRTVIGFLTVISGFAGGMLLGWWLGTEGDVVEIIHRAKMSLPDWAWMVIKVGLSAVSGFLFMGVLVALAIGAFAGKWRK